MLDVVQTPTRHPASWWAQFEQAAEHLDAAVVTEALADAIIPKIGPPLLRRETQIATDLAVRHLNKPASGELTERATDAADRLVATVERLKDRSGADDPATTEADALCHVLKGDWAEAAALAEPYVGTAPLAKAYVAALALERIDGALTLRLVQSGQSPTMAVRAGLAIGKYGWWPSWLQKVVTEKALAGTLDENTITALDQCAYADLSPAQARLARKLLEGDQALIDASAQRLETVGEHAAAVRLRDGDIAAVAIAARVVPL